MCRFHTVRYFKMCINNIDGNVVSVNFSPLFRPRLTQRTDKETSDRFSPKQVKLLQASAAASTLAKRLQSMSNWHGLELAFAE